MEMRLSSIAASKYTVLIIVQLVVNVSLAVWLYNEYLHNPFMQMYLSDAWASIWPLIAGIVGVAAVGLGFTLFRRRSSRIVEKSRVIAGAVGSGATLAALDVCPFCETPLKSISMGRLQCRSCRRYFKSGLPKVPA